MTAPQATEKDVKQMTDGYRHYYGLCEDCDVLVQIEVGPDAGPNATLPSPDEWEDFGLRCPVCSSTVPGGYEGADNWTTDDEKTRRVRAEYELARLREQSIPPGGESDD